MTTGDGMELAERALLEERSAGLTQRAELIAEVMTALTETLDTEVAVGRLAQIVVPTLAEWCIVTLVEHDDAPATALRDIGWWHAEEAGRELVEEYANLRLEALHEGSFIHHALVSRVVQVVQTDATSSIRAALHPGRARDIFDVLAPETGAVFPIRGRGRTVGLLTLFRGAAHGEFSADELRTCGKVAAAAGLALDTSRLYNRQRRIAEGLQRVMLTAPPEPDDIRIAVRYVPAAEAAQVGGDWYDAFLQQDGSTVIVIGDVVGHDLVAAATMGQVRSMLRGIGVATGVGPADLLHQVDSAIHLLRSRAVASAVVARVEQERHDGELHRTSVRWSNAGHPPPMLIRPDGGVDVLTAGPSDLLLGVRADENRHEHIETVPCGSTLLLYTDGLVERRTEGLREGLARLQAVLLEASHLPLEELCDEILTRMLPEPADDDVALVAVRLERTDRAEPTRADAIP